MRFSVLAGLALAVATCRTGGPSGVAPGAPAGSAVTVAGAESLQLELLLEPRARAGEPVRMRLRAQNVAGHPLDLYLRGREITFDIVITRVGGGVVWRRLEGEIIPAIVQLRPLAPGERLEMEAVWDQRSNDGKPVGPGELTVEGALLLEGEPLRTPPRPLTIVSAGD